VERWCFAPALSTEYDPKEDVLYVNFGSNELSVTDEVSEDLLIDIGYYSGTVTGFKVIGPKAKGLTVDVMSDVGRRKYGKKMGGCRRWKDVPTRQEIMDWRRDGVRSEGKRRVK